MHECLQPCRRRSDAMRCDVILWTHQCLMMVVLGHDQAARRKTARGNVAVTDRHSRVLSRNQTASAVAGRSIDISGCATPCQHRIELVQQFWCRLDSGLYYISVVMVNRTETAVFCYLQASSSPRCFRPKTARCLCVFIFS